MTDSFTRRNTADTDKKLEAEEFSSALGTIFRPRVATIAASFSERFSYDGSGNVEYHGRAVPGSVTSGAVWALRKFAYDGSNNLLSVLWADGDTLANNVWDGRAGLTYS